MIKSEKMFVLPNVGQRFVIAGSEYEVAHCDHRHIRYASCKGGKQHNCTVDKFDELSQNKTFKFTSNIHNIAVPTVEKDINERNRKLAYVNVVLINNINENDFTVQTTIKNIATLRKEKAPATSTVYRWLQQYIEKDYNPNSLLPKRTKRKQRNSFFGTDVDEAIDKLINAHYLTMQRITATAAAILIKDDLPFMEGIDASTLGNVSIRTIRRRIAALDPHTVMSKRMGKHMTKKLFKAAGKSKITARPLQEVEADGHIMDILLVDPSDGEEIGRPYLTLIIDRNTRCVLSYTVSFIPFSNVTLLQTMKGALNTDNGLPGGSIEKLLVDNGCDYISNATKNLCNHVGTTIEYGGPRDPDSKPFVERFFGTLNTQLVHQLKGTTFSNPNDKGEYDSVTMCEISIAELEGYISKWIEIYHKRYHSSLADCPTLAWDKGLKRHSVAMYKTEDIDLFARCVSRRTINNGRVRSENLFWYSHALATIEQRLKSKKKKAIIDIYIDELDLSQVYVKDPFDENNYILAVSTKSEYTSKLSLYEHRLIETEKLSYSKSYAVTQLEDEANQLRRELWHVIETDTAKNKRKKRRLTKGNKNKAVAEISSVLDKNADTAAADELMAAVTKAEDQPINSDSSDQKLLIIPCEDI